MATSKQQVDELFRETSRQIVTNGAEYLRFLRTAGINYKYCFADQVMIYAQHPTATACAPIKTWNRLGRYVKRNTSGIALLPRDTDGRLRYIFDMADTVDSKYKRAITLWQVPKGYENDILRQVAQEYGIADCGGAAESIQCTAEYITEISYRDYLSELEQHIPGCALKDAHAPVSEIFCDLLKKSIACMTAQRCGMTAPYAPEDFEDIRLFDTIKALNILGDAASQLSEMVLRQIEVTAKKNYKRTQQ